MNKPLSDKQIAFIKEEVLSKLPQGWTLRQIFGQKGMCSLKHFFVEILPNDEAFGKQYARAFELRADYWADEMVDIAEDGTNDWMEREIKGGLVIEVQNPETAARSRLRVETRKWIIARAAPKKYGDKLALVDPVDPEKPLTVTLKIDNS